MKKQFFAAAMILALGAGFTACSNDDLGKNEGKEVAQNGTAYMSVSFTLPAPATTRAETAPAAGTETPRYQYGSWNGQDKIKSVKVYVFGDGNKLEKVVELSGTQLSLNQKGSGDVLVASNEAFKVKAGTKTVYVVVNPTDVSNNLLPAVTTAGTETTLADFEAKYKSAEAAFTGSAYPTQAVDKTFADQIASVDGQSDVILMTGDKASVEVKNGVTEQEAISGAKNQAKLSVQRAVARVLVTSKTGATIELKGDNPTTKETETEFTLATISDLTYTVAQGEQKFNFFRTDYGTNGETQDTEGSKAYEQTPAFTQKTENSDDFWAAANMAAYTKLIEHYDYSGLWLNEKKGFEVKSRTAFLNAADKEKEEIGNVTTHITTASTGDHGLFLLPTTHKYGATADASDYRKTNTAYILVRATITPKLYVDKQGKLKTDEALKGKDFYLGANGLVYADKTCVQDTSKMGVKGQTAKKYVGGKALYFVWVHPDKLSGTLNSPVDRNNIYHVQLKGVGSWGANWNPLVPYPKNTTPPDFSNPNTPPVYPRNPNNPNDRPNDNEFEPKNPPVNPYENLTPTETWMAADVTIAPWAVHSYEVVLK